MKKALLNAGLALFALAVLLYSQYPKPGSGSSSSSSGATSCGGLSDSGTMCKEAKTDYLGVSATAADSSKLGGTASASYALKASYFAIANNLSEGTAGTMRTNLGLGTAATVSSTCGADLSGTLPNCTVASLNGVSASTWAATQLVYGRLTTESGVCVSTSDRTAQSTIYWTSCGDGATIALYDGSSSWNLYTYTERSLALSGLTSGKNYDVFLYNNSGTLTLELSAAWTDDATRSQPLTMQNGIFVKSGATTRRYLGTIRTTGTTTTEDSGGITGTTQTGGKRFVWNYYNRVERAMTVIDTVDSFSYTTNTWRQYNGAAGNKVELVIGQAEDSFTAEASSGVITTTGGTGWIGIGLDATSSPSGIRTWMFIDSGAGGGPALGRYVGQFTTAGYHYIAWLQKGSGAGGTTWFGDAGGDGTQAGLTTRTWN